MNLPESVRKRSRAYGREGGRRRSVRMSPESRKVEARNAAVRRWVQVRFGTPDFESVGLPGGGAIDTGLADLAAGKESIESLVVSLAAPRLKREGVPLPRNLFPNAEMRLYRLLEETSGDLAHSRYLAWLRRAVSFADACVQARMA